MSAMECIVELRDPDFRTGLDGAEVKGLSVLSGRLLSSSQIEPETSGVIALAGKLARHAGIGELKGEIPAAGHDEITTQVTTSTALVARILSWFPPMLVRPLLKTSAMRQKLAIIDALLPPAPAALFGETIVTVREHVILNLCRQPGTGPDLTASGQITIKMGVQRSITKAALRRYLKKISSKKVVSAGYLLFSGRLGLEWTLDSESPQLGRTIGRHVVALEDLTCDPGFAELKADALSNRAISGVSMPLQAKLKYELPALQADKSRLGKLFMIAASIPGEGEVRRLDFMITLRPDAEKPSFPQLFPAQLEIKLPNYYPPVENAVVRITGHTQSPDTTGVMPEVGSGILLSMTCDSPLSPGESMIVSLTFRDEGSGGKGIVNQGGLASLHLGFDYDRPLSGIESCRLIPRSGRLGDAQQRINVGMASLRIDVACEVLLDGLKFPTVKREAEVQPAGPASAVDLAFIRTIVERLSLEHIQIRQALQGQSSGYGDGKKTDISWDLHGRYEKSMAGPDVHIAIRSENSSGSSLAKFEITVLGRGVLQEDHDDVQKVQRAVNRALNEVVAFDHRQSYTSTSRQQEKTPDAASFSDSIPESQNLDAMVKKLENLLERFEGMIQMAEMGQVRK